MDWLALSRDNRNAANVLLAERSYRSAVSRAYYSVYSRLAHELIRVPVAMPKNREGPSHKRLRPLVETNLTSIDASRRIAVSRIVGRMYELRVFADYFPTTSVEGKEAREAVSLLRKAFDLL